MARLKDDFAPTIRHARASDTERIVLLTDQLGYPLDPETVLLRLNEIARDAADTVVFVAEEAGAGVVGWIQVSLRRALLTGRQAVIDGIVVDAEHRGVGLGRILVEGAERWAAAGGIPTVRLGSNTRRAGAHEFWRQLGYEEIKTQRIFLKELEKSDPDELDRAARERRFEVRR